MSPNLSVLLKKFRVKGFVGPAYAGLFGKLRLAWEEFIIRTEIVFVAAPSTLKPIVNAGEKPVEIEFITKSDDLESIKNVFDRAYYPGFTENWGRTIDAGEVLILGLIDVSPAAFIWMQKGKADGVGCYYAQFLQGDARLYRAGVMPEYRRKGVYTRFIKALLARAFESGDIEHVYIDNHKANVAAYNAHLKSGFIEKGRIKVYFGASKWRFIRWQ